MTQKTPTDFDSRWKQVEELMKKDGLTRSAIEKVKEIQVLAKKENQPAHEIKALIYLSELMPDITDGEHVEIDSIQNEIKSAKTPVKQLLHSLLATRYYQLYEENRWDLFERTATSSFDEKDPETWSLADFHRVISSHYLASLENENELKQTGLKNYSTILVKGNSENLRPTLYDLLAHQALGYFENDERDVPSPVNVFHVDDPVVFSPAEKFSKAKINTSDSSSLYFRALVLYQELLSFHLTDKDPSALLDADLARLEFARRVSIDPDKNQQYIKALELISAAPYGSIFSTPSSTTPSPLA